MRNFLLYLLLLFPFGPVQAQQFNPVNGLPDWVLMIDNPATNYFDAIRSFDRYWADREKPFDPEEEENERQVEQERDEHAIENAAMSPAEREHKLLIAYHYKRFKNWIREIKPYVQEDGRILSMDERMNIWYRQQAESRNSNQK